MRRGGLAVRVGVVVAAVVVGVGAVVVARSADRSTGDGPPTETVVIAAPRGRIFDRSGKVLVEDATVLELRADAGVVDALEPTERTALVDALAAVVTPDEAVAIEDRLASAEGTVVLASGVTDEARAAVEADPDRVPGVTVEPVSARTYRYGSLAAHLLGYLGRISADQHEQRADEALDEDAIIGQAGIERAMDEELRGVPGQVVYEVDDAGHRVRELIDRREEPEPGRDVYLTIDVNLQYLVEKGLAAEVERRRGVQDDGCYLPGGCDPPGAASVALDPRDGQVLAMASYPTYDPALFVGGISTEEYGALTDTGSGSPLLNRAIGGSYVPGSTLKPFTAHAGLATGLITPAMVYDDTGVHRYRADCAVEAAESNCTAQNTGAVAHGPIDLAAALRVSSDTYFYALGDDAWRARDDIGEDGLQEQLTQWGFGERTGIDLVGEVPGRVPTPAWLMDFALQLNGDTEEARAAGTWTSGVSGNMAVGQGDVLVTPLQLASAYGTLANGGTIWRPRVVLQVTDAGAGTGVEVTESESTGEVDLPSEWRDPMIAALDGATKEPDGTATTGFTGFDQSACPVAGKTGTALVIDKNDTSLFAAVAPAPADGRDAVIAMATVVEGAGTSGAAAVPVTRRVLEPFAAMDCDITRFGEPDSPYAAPVGGAFDVDEAIAEYVPPPSDASD